ncbi:MAG: hypothetical protein IKC10_05195 [Alphaproteobacteria bacterium]|nr:hypothetical protein [Alphaproteobacteria bacterium]
MTDNKEIIDEKRFSEILEILNILKENNYENISEEHYTQFNSALSYARSELPRNDEPFKNLMSVSERQKEFNEKIDGRDPDGFLNRHFDNLEKEYQIGTLPSSEIKEHNKVEYQELLPFDFMPQTELKREENKEYYQKAEDILEKLKEANPFFKEALKDKEVNFKILEGKDNDGKFCYDEYIRSEGKTVTINLESSLFAESGKGKEMLPMVIAHEFGHFIDVAKRPLGYTGMLQDKQEFFADILGAKMAQNAGYEKSITAFKENLNSKKDSLLKSRAKLLNERYPETNTKINSDRIAELRGITPKPPFKTTQTNINPNSVKLYKENTVR